MLRMRTIPIFLLPSLRSNRIVCRADLSSACGIYSGGRLLVAAVGRGLQEAPIYMPNQLGRVVCFIRPLFPCRSLLLSSSSHALGSGGRRSLLCSSSSELTPLGGGTLLVLPLHQPGLTPEQAYSGFGCSQLAPHQSPSLSSGCSIWVSLDRRKDTNGTSAHSVSNGLAVTAT